MNNANVTKNERVFTCRVRMDNLMRKGDKSFIDFEACQGLKNRRDKEEAMSKSETIKARVNFGSVTTSLLDWIYDWHQTSTSNI